MELHKWLTTACLSLIFLSLTSCGGKHQKADVKENQQQAQTQAAAAPAQLPTRFQTPGYSVAPEEHAGPATEESDEYQVKVGATIRSTGGPQPLWDVMKRLVNLKGMTVSWASDVDRNVLIDVDISANDNFFEAIANLLRQADYFHEVKGKTIIVRNKDTKVFQIGVPSMKGGYTTTVGGNFLTKREAASGTEGTVKITSADNQFNIWDNIDTNLKVLLGTTITGPESANKVAGGNAQNSPQTGGSNALGGQDASNTVKIDINKTDTKKSKAASEKKDKTDADAANKLAGVSKQTALDGAFFVIDKSIGVITVTAKPVILKNVEDYINNLKKQLYQQIAIEAKIIEVYLQDNSKIGLDWSTILKDFAVTGTTTFGESGQVYPSSGSFISKVSINPVNFTVLLNALNEQGDTRVLANPKLTVLNGQPAIISVGKDIAYVKTVSKEVDSDTNQTTYTAEVDNVVQGIALGVMASVLDGKKIILHLTPITTDVEDLDSNGNIKMTTFGEDALQLGLPKVKVRQMSTMVEVENGEMLVIGGLIDSAEGKTGSFAPGVGSIPIVRYLFGVEEKTMQKRELVILLTPRII
jgi:general secretion pathway protein D/MSHA biogenesis protein MshL